MSEGADHEILRSPEMLMAELTVAADEALSAADRMTPGDRERERLQYRDEIVIIPSKEDLPEGPSGSELQAGQGERMFLREYVPDPSREVLTELQDGEYVRELRANGTSGQPEWILRRVHRPNDPAPLHHYTYLHDLDLSNRAKPHWGTHLTWRSDSSGKTRVEHGAAGKVVAASDRDRDHVKVQIGSLNDAEQKLANNRSPISNPDGTKGSLHDPKDISVSRVDAHPIPRYNPGKPR